MVGIFGQNGVILPIRGSDGGHDDQGGCGVFDRGAALAQLDFAAERIKKSLLKWANRAATQGPGKAHLERLAGAGADMGRVWTSR